MKRWRRFTFSFLTAMLIISSFSTGVSLAAPVNPTDLEVNSNASDLDPYVEVYYDKTYKSDNNTFTADSNHYQMTYNLSTGSAAALKIKQSDFPEENLLAAASLTPTVKVNGQWYSPANRNSEDRLYLHEAGKNMWRVEKKGLELANSAGTLLPLKVDQTFYFWNEKFYMVTHWSPEANIPGIEYAQLSTSLKKSTFDQYHASSGDQNIPNTGAWTIGQLPDQVTLFDSNSVTHGAFTYEIINKSGTESVAISSESAYIDFAQRAYDKDIHSGSTGVWKSGHSFDMFTQIYVSPNNSSADGLQDTEIEMNPLDHTGFSVPESLPHDGSKSLGYDNTMGAYVIDVYTPNVNYYVDHPNYYPTVKINMNNDGLERTIRLKTQLMIIDGSGLYAPGVTGGVAVLTDENLVPNGIPVQISKKWDNADFTQWEGFVHSYAAFPLEANEQKSMWHRTAFQNWGDKVTAGLPSLSLANYGNGSSIQGQLWLETNVGMSEAVCYLLDDNGNATVTDFRAVNGRRIDNTWSPWFQNAGGLEFLQLYNGSRWIDAKRRGSGLRFNSLGPNVSQFEMNLQTQDGEPNVNVHVTTTLLPSENGTRVFYKLHYDFLSNYSFTDINRELSLFSIGDTRYSNSAQAVLAYKDANGQVVQHNVTRNNSWNVVGAELHEDNPWVGLTGGPANTNNVGFVVHEISGSMDGQTLDSAAVSLYATSGKQTAYLIPGASSNQVTAGDYADLLIEAYTWDGTTDYTALQTEAAKWPATIEAYEGSVVQDFPAKVMTGNTGTAEFSLQGGVDYVPVTIGGFSGYGEPKLEKESNGVWEQFDQTVGIKDGWQTDIDPQTGTYQVTYVLPAEDSEARYRISMVTPTIPQIPASLPRELSSAAWIKSFQLDERIQEPRINVQNATISIPVAEGTDVTALTPELILSEGATSQPVSGETVDFTNPVEYSVTSENGTVRQWTVTVTQSISAITGFTIPGQVTSFIDPYTRTVSVYMQEGTNVTALMPTIQTTLGASISPASGTVRNFSQPVQYVLTGPSGVTSDWVVQVSTLSANVALNKTYSSTLPVYDNSAYGAHRAFDGNQGTFWAPVSVTNQWLAVNFGQPTTFNSVLLAEGSGGSSGNRWLSNYVLQVNQGGIWQDIAGTAVSGAPNHPEGALTRLITFPEISAQELRLMVYQAGGGIYVQELGVYHLNNDSEPILNQNDITYFAIPNQVGSAEINTNTHSVHIAVASGTDLSSLIPNLVVSSRASVTPTSGVAQDFNVPVVYTVEAEDGSQQEWTVYVTYQSVNIALNKSYSGSLPVYHETVYAAGKAFDGDVNSFWAPVSVTNQWLSVDFGGPAAFNKVIITEGSGSSSGNRWLSQYVLQYDDGTGWQDIAGTAVSGAPSHPEGALTKTLTFPKVTANALRLMIYQAGGGIYVRELEVYYVDMLQEVLLSTEDALLKIDDQASLSVTGTMIDGSVADLTAATIMYSSDDEHVATVDENGLVTAHSEGIANLRATVYYKGQTLQTEEVFILVDGTPPSYTLTVNGVDFNGGESFSDDTPLAFQLTATDSLSGVALQNVLLNGESYEDGEIMDFAGKLGIHTLSIQLVDGAGNTLYDVLTFEVNTSLASMSNLVTKFKATGNINTNFAANLSYRLYIIQILLEQGNDATAIDYMNDFLAYIHDASVQQQGLISPAATSVLDKDANELLVHWQQGTQP